MSSVTALRESPGPGYFPNRRAHSNKYPRVHFNKVSARLYTSEKSSCSIVDCVVGGLVPVSIDNDGNDVDRPRFCLR